MQIAVPMLASLAFAVNSAAAADWNSLGRVPKERSVKVYLNSGKKLNGNILQVESDGLRLLPDAGRALSKDRSLDKSGISPDDGALRIGRAEIRRVTWRSKKMGALVGSMAAGGSGAIYGAATPSHSATWSQGRGASAIEGAAIIGIVGAIAGAFVGKEITIYNSSSRK